MSAAFKKQNWNWAQTSFTDPVQHVDFCWRVPSSQPETVLYPGQTLGNPTSQPGNSSSLLIPDLLTVWRITWTHMCFLPCLIKHDQIKKLAKQRNYTSFGRSQQAEQLRSMGTTLFQTNLWKPSVSSFFFSYYNIHGLHWAQPQKQYCMCKQKER